MAAEYDQAIEEEIPGMICVLSVIDDEENDSMPAIISHVDDYELPYHFVRGREAGGGVTTYALLKVLDAMKSDDGSRKKRITWADALDIMYEEIEDEGRRRSLPTLSTSRPINVQEECIRLISSSKRGTKRALLIGAHYQDEAEEDVWLASCHTDVRRMRHHLIHEEGFEKQNILVLMDDDRHHEPTKFLILDALEKMCHISKPGDSIFVHFSGHGGTLMNEQEYDEEGIMHELLAPGDFRDNGVGVLMDDELYASFVSRVPEGVYAMAVIDTCHPSPSHSGKASAIDLPYVCSAGEDDIRESEGFRPGRMMMASTAVGAGVAAGLAAMTLDARKKKNNKKYDEDEEEINDPSYDDEYYESEKPKHKTKKKSKKKKKEIEEEETEEPYDNSYEGVSEESEKAKSKKKKQKKKKKEEHSRNDEEYLDEEQEEIEDKQKKKKKKSKKKQ